MSKWLPLIAAGLIIMGILTGCAREIDTSVTSVPETVLKIPGGVQSPPGSPIIILNSFSRNASTCDYLYIYRDGSVIAVAEGQKRTDLGRPGFRIWKTGKIEASQIKLLSEIFKESIPSIQDNYHYSGYGNAETGLYTGDMDIYLKYDFQNIQKTVRAYNFLSKYSSYLAGTYAGLPSPLAEIYEKLNRVSLETLQVMRQDIP
jgi:hypothetical protein